MASPTIMLHKLAVVLAWCYASLQGLSLVSSSQLTASSPGTVVLSKDERTVFEKTVYAKHILYLTSENDVQWASTGEDSARKIRDSVGCINGGKEEPKEPPDPWRLFFPPMSRLRMRKYVWALIRDLIQTTNERLIWRCHFTLYQTIKKSSTIKVN